MTVIQSRFELFQYSMIGIVVYSYVVRFQGFWPFHTSWLFNIREENVDASANYLGWEFFRHGPLSLWPISSIPGLGPIGGSSVAMTDSLSPLNHSHSGSIPHSNISDYGYLLVLSFRQSLRANCCHFG